MKTTIAIDPGSAGGYAVHAGNGKFYASNLPETEGDFIEEMRNLYSLSDGPPTVVFEDVPKYCQHPNIPASSIAVLYGSYRFMVGVCMTLGFRVELASPKKWQKPFAFGVKGGQSTSAWKNKMKSAAQRLFPGVPVTLKTADALLILLWYLRYSTPQGADGIALEQQYYLPRHD